jgi:hypothetical protein
MGFLQRARFVQQPPREAQLADVALFDSPRTSQERATSSGMLCSAVPTMTISKSQASKAGVALAKAEDPDAPSLVRQSEIVDEWRALHGAPMYWMAESVRGRVSRVVRHVAVGQRLKRKRQIIAKLAREGTKLARMQDVGGCRAVVDTAPEVILAADRIERSGPYYDIIRRSDYRDHGRADTGYRAFHLIALRDGHQIEIQLRTLRQQAWAEAVERAANRSQFDLKSGHGPADMLEFFRLASDALHALDGGRVVSAAHRAKLRALQRVVLDYLRPVVTADRPAPAELRRREFSSRLNNWLIVYDWRAARFAGWSDLGADTAEAAKTYASFERRYRYDDGYEVVLIGADSTDTIKRTHAHYFGKDPNDFDPLDVFAAIL